MQAVAVADPFICQEILHSTELDKRPNTGYWIVTEMMSAHNEPNLVSSESTAYWRAVRKTVAVAFSSSAMRNNFEQICSAGQDMVKVLKGKPPGESVDMFRGLLCVSVDVISRFGFKKDFGAVSSFGGGDGRHDFLDSILLATKEAQEFLKKPYRQLLWFLPEVKKSYQTFRDFQSFMEKLVCDMRSSEPVSYDTSAVTMTWAMYMIAQHPQVEAKLVAELKAHGLLATPDNPNPPAPTYKQLMELDYLSHVVQETQRLYPAVAFGTSRCSPHKDVYLDNGRLRVPKGTIVWVLTHSLQNSSFTWEHPERFDPGRWEQQGADQASPMPGKARAIIGSMERHASKPLDHPFNIAAESQAGNYEPPQLRLSRVAAQAQSSELEAALSKFNEQQTGDPKAPLPKRWIPFMDGRRSCLVLRAKRVEWEQVSVRSAI
ncbi:hypothetical protein WJX84_000073 [Apatococcus fuscideae]|uniref:Cytochrome P450 n=1 Tax=Apatococcus fuscideae TaxID=2026836 RepID=A0AAW1TAG1_9CHLO